MTVVEFQHVKPGKGGAFVRTKLKNFRTGAVLERTFRADEKLPLGDDRQARDAVPLPRRPRARLHGQRELRPAPRRGQRPRRRRELPQGGRLRHPPDLQRRQVVGVELPAAVELTVTETEPGVQGDRVSGARKPATLETGLVVQVPLFVEPGETIKVDTRTGEYLAAPERASRTPDGHATRSRVVAAGAASSCYEARGTRTGSRPLLRDRIRHLAADDLLAELPRPDPYASDLVRGVDEHRDEIDVAARQVLRALGRRPDAGGRPRAAAHRHLRARVASPSCPPASSSTRPSSSRRSTPPRTRAGSSTGCCPASPRSCVREQRSRIEARVTAGVDTAPVEIHEPELDDVRPSPTSRGS